MNDQIQFAQAVIGLLEKAEIPYMFSGSMSSSFYGNYRTTNDIDIVIDPSREQLLNFLTLLGNEYYYNKETAIQALSYRTMFNIVFMKTGCKADLMICKDREYSKLEFSRRQTTTLRDTVVSTVSPEDSILSKLEWAKDSGSQKQLDDVRAMLKVQKNLLDYDYLNEWAQKLGVYKNLQTLMNENST